MIELTRELLLARAQTCPVCEAGPGEDCRPFSLTRPHRDRVNAARKSFDLESVGRVADFHARHASGEAVPGFFSGDAA